MSPDSISTCLRNADLLDWQVLAELQQAATAAGLSDLAAGLSPLFSDSLTPAQVEEARSCLIALLPGSAPDVLLTAASAAEALHMAVLAGSDPSEAIRAVDALGLPDASAHCQEWLAKPRDDVAAATLSAWFDAQLPGTAVARPVAVIPAVAHAVAHDEFDPAAVEPVVESTESALLPHAEAMDVSLASGGLLPEAAAPEALVEFLAESQEHLQRVEGLVLHLVGADAGQLDAVFRSFHTIKGLSGFLGLRREQTLAHAAEDLLERLRTGKQEVNATVCDLLLAALDQMQALFTGLEACATGAPAMADCPELPALVAALRAAAAGRVVSATQATHRQRQALDLRTSPLGEVLVETGVVDRATVDAALAAQRLTPERRLGEILVEAGKATTNEIEQALRQQSVPAAARVAVPATMRVDVERVDALNDAIGELVIAQNMVACCPELKGLSSRRVQGLLAQLDRVTKTIQGMSMRLRLVSVQPVFQRMERLARDTAKKLNKAVEVELTGADQELDRSVVDRIGDPLVHLVRNAIDHGLEPAQVRSTAGKPLAGKVFLRAYRTTGAFVVEVGDDGKGLDRERILAKAVERGLVRPEAQLSDDEVNHLIFLPGFSTAEVVTDVSGRGVGMDVVKRMVEEMRGSLHITSVLGQGTTIQIHLPLTLAIIDGMVVGADDQQYVIPTLAVAASLRPSADEFTQVCGRGRMFSFLGRQIPLVRLRDLFGLPGDDDHRSLVVVVDDGNRRAGLVVDRVLGRQSVVLKAMSRGLPTVHGVGGATINGDGKVCLVLDINGILTLAGASASSSAAA